FCNSIGTKRTCPLRRSVSAFGGKSKIFSCLSYPQPTTEVEAHPTLLEWEDSTLVAWYRSLYAPRTGGAYDSHHRTKGVTGCTRRRGGGVAARGAGAARRTDAAHWRAAAGRPGRRGISILARSVPPGARASGLDHRTQYTDRNTVDQIRRRGNAQICGRTGGARAGRHRRDWQLNGGTLVAPDPHGADRVPGRRRSGRHRPR